MWRTFWHADIPMWIDDVGSGAEHICRIWATERRTKRTSKRWQAGIRRQRVLSQWLVVMMMKFSACNYGIRQFACHNVAFYDINLCFVWRHCGRVKSRVSCGASVPGIHTLGHRSWCTVAAAHSRGVCVLYVMTTCSQLPVISLSSMSGPCSDR